jgi:hypothetical protein
VSWGFGTHGLVSRTVKDLTPGSGSGFTDRGTHSLKGITDTGSCWPLLRDAALVHRPNLSQGRLPAQPAREGPSCAADPAADRRNRSPYRSEPDMGHERCLQRAPRDRTYAQNSSVACWS